MIEVKMAAEFGWLKFQLPSFCYFIMRIHISSTLRIFEADKCSACTGSLGLANALLSYRDYL